MARVLGVELVTLLLLGFAIGILSFMYWSTKRELSALQGDNERLSRTMLKSASETKTIRYKESLIESDLEKLRKDLTAKKEAVSTLTEQVADLEGQLVKSKTALEEEQKKFSKYSSEKEETQGIQDRLLADIEGCRKSLKKCEDLKGAAAKAATATCSKKTKTLEDTKKDLMSKLETADEKILALTKQVEGCTGKA